jgi:hypothetical protein
VTLVKQDGASSVLYSKKGRRKRVSRPLRPLERLMRRELKAGDAFTSNMLRRHEKSRSKRRDGWLRDAPSNVMKASSKAWKELRKI